jgi:hypothetical protein
MDRFDDDILAAELRLLRPTPRPEFTAELDERAAAGFPRRAPRPGAGRFARLAAHWHDVSPRRPLFAVIGLAMAVLAVATVVVISSSSTEEKNSSDIAMSGGTSERASRPEVIHVGGGAASEARMTPAHKAASHAAVPKKAEKSYSVEAEAAEESGAVEEVETESAPKAASAQPFDAKAPSIAIERDIERSAYVVLGTKPGEVAGAVAKVYEAVHAAHGFVLSSSVQSGTTGATGASFELSIPTRKVDDALAAISAIAEVRERHDATNDITAPTVNATEELRDSNASIEGLLKELGDVETEAERESVEARLREERRHHAAIRAKLDNLDKRAAMSEVSVRIVTSRHSGVAPAGKGSGGGWGVGDALHDAGKVLTVAAGVLLIALAVLAPIALIALLVWSLNRFRVRRLRERALG